MLVAPIALATLCKTVHFGVVNQQLLLFMPYYFALMLMIGVWICQARLFFYCLEPGLQFGENKRKWIVY